MSRKSSPVWDVFEKEGGNRARCRVCSVSYSTSGGTSNLRDHVRRRHGGMLDASTTRTTQWADAVVISTTDERPIFLPVFQNSRKIVLPNSGGQKDEEIKDLIHSKEQEVKDLDYCRDQEAKDLDHSRVQEAKDLDRALAMFVAQDVQPLSIVQDAGFQHLIGVLNPRYKLPTKLTLSKDLIPALYEEAKKNLKVALAGACKIAVSVDMWTSNHQESFMALSCHFINNGKLTSGCLDVSVLPGRHTTENILAEHLSDVLVEWDVAGKVAAVVTDNTSRMKVAVRLTDLHHLPCVAHMLNQLICDSIRDSQSISSLLEQCSDIVAHFKHSSVASELLQSIQRTSQTLELHLIQQVPTRWNSKLAMIRRLIEVKEHLILAQAQLLNMPQVLTAEEWMILGDVVSILQPFEAMTTSLSAETFVSASQIIPLVHGLHAAIHSGQQLCTTTGDAFRNVVATHMHSGLLAYESLTIARSATFLDPRFKKFAFRVQKEAENARKEVEIEVQHALSRREQQDPSPEEQLQIPEHFEGHPLLGFLGARVNQGANPTPASSAAVLLRQYEELPPVSSRVDPVQYWNGKEEGLAEVAKSYLCVPATSVPCECIFSRAGEILNDRRNSLSANKAKQLIFLKGNSHFIN